MTAVTRLGFCMVCGELRPHPKIDEAFRRVAGLEHEFPSVRHTVTFCNDRDTCRAEGDRQTEPWLGMRPAVRRALIHSREITP